MLSWDVMLGQGNDTFPQLKVQDVQCDGSNFYVSGSDDGWKKNWNF